MEVVDHYFDDILISSKSIQDGMEKLIRILSALKDAGITLRIEKFQLFDVRVDYLGHKVTGEGVKLQFRKINAVQGFKRPADIPAITTISRVSFIFPDIYIQHYAVLAVPSIRLLSKIDVCGKKSIIWRLKSSNRNLSRGQFLHYSMTLKNITYVPMQAR